MTVGYCTVHMGTAGYCEVAVKVAVGYCTVRLGTAGYCGYYGYCRVLGTVGTAGVYCRVLQ